MSLARLLDDLDAASVQLWAEGGELKFRAPRGALDAGLRERVTAMKPALLAQLPDSDPEAARHAPFAQTPIQQAYLVGRTEALAHGGVAANSYIEFDSDGIDLARAEDTLNAMIAGHDMLRTVLCEDGLQQVLREVPRFRLEIADLRGLSVAEQAARRAALRKELSEKRRDPMRWPLFDLQFTRIETGVRLHSCVDLIVLDAWSSKLFFEEWFARMAGEEVPPPPGLRFRDCVRRAQKSPAAADRAYWEEALDRLPPAPDLPRPWRNFQAHEGGGPRFRRLKGHLDAESWSRFARTCRRYQVTPASALATAFANVLSCWSANEDLCLNLTLFNRPPLHDEIERVLGEFTSTTLMGFDGMTRGFGEQARAAQAQLLEKIEHSAISGVELLRDLARRRGSFAGSLMPVVFTSLLRGDGRETRETGNWRYVDGISQTPQVTLDHQAFHDRGGLGFNWDVAEAVIDPDAAAAAFETYRALLERLADDPQSWEAPPPRALPAAQARRRAALHRPTGHTPAEGGIDGAFWDGLAAHAARPAVITSAGTLSHEELARAAAGCAARLAAEGVEPGDRVAIMLEKGPMQVVAVLAALYLGAVYVPLDPAQPRARLGAILARTEPAALLCAEGPGFGICPELAMPSAGDGPDMPLTGLRAGRHRAGADQPAYILFTSGSTGTPKGVCLSHGAVLNTIEDMSERFGMDAGDRVFGLSALSFDLSVYDVFAPLRAGGALVLPDPGQGRNPEHWLALMERHEVTVWNSVPALLQMLTTWMAGAGRALPRALRLALVSGDWVPLALGTALSELSPARLVALGGATEAAIWSNWQDMAEARPDWPSVPYGAPLSGQYYRVLDRYGADRPDLVPGALHIGGLGLAGGYWRDEEKTRRAFRDHDGERLYDTGDYGRFWPDTVLEFLGRRDGQVKIGGYRVELGEVTHALERHPSVQGAAALARDGRILAYAVAPGADEAGLRAHCAGLLPDYMCPSRLILIERLPLTANGKLDAAALPDPAPEVPAPRRADSPVREVFADRLGGLPPDPERNFFELGLNSVDLVAMHREIAARLPVALPVADLFIHTTIEALERRIAELSVRAPGGRIEAGEGVS